MTHDIRDDADTEPPEPKNVHEMTDHEILLNIYERIERIEKRLGDGDSRMGRIEANIGLIGNAAVVALNRSGHTEVAERFSDLVEKMYAANGGFQDEPTNPGRDRM